MAWLLVIDGLVWQFQKLLIYWYFPAQPSLGFTKRERKYSIQLNSFFSSWHDQSFWPNRKKHWYSSGVLIIKKNVPPRINTSPLYSAHLTVWSCTGAYILVDAQLQAAILNHVNAVISVTGSEESLSLVQLDQHHMTTQLQKQRFLEVPEHPVCARHSSVTASWDNHATYQRMNIPNTDCETTDESLQWPSHSFLVYR